MKDKSDDNTAPAPAFTDLLRQNHSCTFQAGKPLCRFSEAQDGEWVHITDLRRWIGERPAPAPVTVSDEMVEHCAEAVYRRMLFNERNGTKPPWVTGGNALKQDEARGYARAVLKAASFVTPVGWMPCASTVPDAGRSVWIYRNGAVMAATREPGHYQVLGGTRLFDHNNDVTHWMPRPLPPPPTDKAREVNDGKA